jgi:hypothetical protein
MAELLSWPRDVSSARACNLLHRNNRQAAMIAAINIVKSDNIVSTNRTAQIAAFDLPSGS